MLGVEFDFDVSALRKKWLSKTYFLSGSSNKKFTKLPPLTITTAAIDTFIVALQESLAELK
jgi:acetylornithine aminotransferase